MKCSNKQIATQEDLSIKEGQIWPSTEQESG